MSDIACLNHSSVTAKAATLGAVAVGVVKDDDLGGRFRIGDILTHAEDIIEATDFPKNPVLVGDCGR